MSDFVPVIDTSAWQSKYTGRGGKLKPGALPFNFALARDRGVRAVIHRCGNGRDFDESFPLAYRSAKDAEIAIGAYYYCQPNVGTPEGIAKMLDEWLCEYELDMRIMLDLEEYWGDKLPPVKMATWVRGLINELEALGYPTPFIYTSAWWWNDHVEGDFTDIDTMQARYRNGRIPPDDATRWPEWAFANVREPRQCNGLRVWDGWQFSSEANGPAFGVPTDAATRRLDTNIVRAEAFDRWVITGEMAPAPSDDGDTELTLDELYELVGPWDPTNGHFQLWPFNLDKAVIRKNSRGKAVEYLQGMLRKYVDPDHEVTGHFAENTDRVVRSLQKMFNVTVDGVVGWHGDSQNPGPQATWPIVDLLPWFHSLNE